MTVTDADTAFGLGEISLTVHRQGTADVHAAEVRDIYGAVYSEPPYCEGPDDVADFARTWPRRQAQPGFRLVMAWHEGTAIGFTFGHELGVRTPWWDGLQGDVSPGLTEEHEGRTFAVIELAVLKPFRRHGIAHELHTHLLAGLPQQRATLLVRPDAEPAQRAYRSWGYQYVGRLQPYPDAPVYDAMVLELPARATLPG
ncbi:MAG: GNAT family N-acetyltransferase [Pseudonocardia sp.]